MNPLVTPQALRAVVLALEQELKDVEANPTYYRPYGICMAINSAFSKYLDLKTNAGWRMKTLILQATFVTWPEYSGYIHTPIKCPVSLRPNLRANAEYAYNYFKQNGMMWNPECEYGRSRIRLAKHIIAECEKYLEKVVDTDFARV